MRPGKESRAYSRGAKRSFVAGSCSPYRGPVEGIISGIRELAAPPRTAHGPSFYGARDDIPGLPQRATSYLLPSRYEGLPLVAIEALCAGVPVLAADVLSLEWLRAFPAATLAPLSPCAWGAAIQTVLSRDWSAEAELSAQAARVRFNPARGVAEYAAIYEGVLPAGSPSTQLG